MLRLECLRAIYSRLQDCLVITIMGAVATELDSLGHRSNFFYLQHATGLASSTGLGLAMCLPHEMVVVFDGDGSLFMNLGGLTTLAVTGPPTWCTSSSTTNPCSPSAAFPPPLPPAAISKRSRAAPASRGSSTVHAIDEFTQTFDAAIQATELACIVARVDAVGPKSYATDLALLENRFQFQRHIESLKRK